jgi:hypothetical protein
MNTIKQQEKETDENTLLNNVNSLGKNDILGPTMEK